jgi:hypothetical protein
MPYAVALLKVETYFAASGVSSSNVSAYCDDRVRVRSVHHTTGFEFGTGKSRWAV